MSPWRPRSLFGQLVLVIALVLAGAGVLALLLAREVALQPAAGQMLRALQTFAQVVETLDRQQAHARTLQQLRDAGLEVRDTPPPDLQARAAPLLRELGQQAGELGPGRDLQIGVAGRERVVWLKPATRDPMWIALSYERQRAAVGRYPIILLAGCVLLVWLAAAYFARRLVLPLRRLAAAAPAIVSGEREACTDAGMPAEVAELGKALAAAGENQRAANNERALLLAGISHDLRTPLTRLQFALELLPDTDPDLRAGMERDIAEMDAILGQFIAYARDGRDEGSETVDLAAICRYVVGSSSQAWQVDLPEQATLPGKPMALLRAVENLVVNAERHGAPPLALRLRGSGACWLLDVADGGPGLPPALAERVRQPFVHDGSRGGSGLGLAIVERVARQHGGSLDLLPNHELSQGLIARLRLRRA